MSINGDGKTRLLGLDVGERRIGLAISDRDGSLATPYNTIERHGLERDIAAILKLVRQEEVGTIVVGEPLSLDGSVGPQAKRTLAFYEALKAASPVPVDTWDERFSTVEAERLLREAGIAPSRNRARLDAAAAAVILQGYLDAHRQPAA
ncbi:MAG: Holliday junction resolvase RuvX [Dehalococcoidia bacterium]|nr:Holliday junction resolvase RuvX [Dehalococcoidia bacterium]